MSKDISEPLSPKALVVLTMEFPSMFLQIFNKIVIEFDIYVYLLSVASLFSTSALIAR